MADEKKIIYLKHCEVVSQPEYIDGKVGDIIRAHKVIKKYAYILHDKDPDTSPHYHIYLNFGRTGIPLPDIAKWFGLQESCVERIKGRPVDVLKYLVHGNDSQINKHQYDYSEVVANFDFLAEIETDKVLGDFEKYSYAQQLQYVNNLPVSEKTQAFTKLEKLWKIYCQCLVLNNDRDIDVMFIDGKGGTGKTYYAKKLLTRMGYDYCVSSSSNDPFQDYLGQKAIILDDLRDSAFDFEDLVKMRKLCDNDLFYLVYDIKDKQIKQAQSLENCGISYDGDDERNLANDCERVRKCHEAGLKTATWAVDDLDKIEKIYNAGTKFITTNAILY